MVIITDKSFKYNLEKLDSASDEFILVNVFFATTKVSTDDCFDYLPEVTDLTIYKVNENNPIKSVEGKRNNLMLFHGTSRKGAAGILKEGFKNSKSGWYGKGVYMTECSDVAFSYSLQHNNRVDYTIFVNEVLESTKLQTFEIVNITGDIDTPLENPFKKHIDKSSPQATEENYKEDHKGRKYRNIGHDSRSICDEYVAEEGVTIPRYLIIFEAKIKKNY